MAGVNRGKPMLVNLGEIMNRGFEAQFGWKDRIGKEWSYFLSANAAYNKNWVADIGVPQVMGPKVSGPAAEPTARFPISTRPRRVDRSTNSI